MSYRKCGVTQSLSCLPHQVEFICHPLCVCVYIHAHYVPGIGCGWAGGSVLIATRDVQRMNGAREM